MSLFAPALGSVLLVIVAQVLLKVGTAALDQADRDTLRHPLRFLLRAIRVPAITVGLSLYVLSAGLWIFALSLAPLSLVYPLLGLSYVGVTLAAVVFLRERFAPVQWLGLVTIVVGVMMVAASR